MRSDSDQLDKVHGGQKGSARSRAWRYGVALASVAVACGVRVVLDPVLGPHTPFVTFYGAIALAVWFGGFGSGLMALILGLVTANFFFIAPRYTLFQDASPTNVIGSLSYCSVGLI